MNLYDSALVDHGQGQITTKVINGVECYVYIPSNVTSDTNVSIYFPGGIGGANTVGKGTTAQEYLRNMNPDSIVILPGSYDVNMDNFGEGIINYANELVDHYGLNSHKYAVCSFSYGSVPQSKFLEYQLSNYPETASDVVGYIDSFCGNYGDTGSGAFTGYTGDPSNFYALLVNNDKTVCYFGRVGVDEVRAPFRDMMNAGVSFIYAKPNSGNAGHVGAEANAMHINMIDFLNGNFSDLLESNGSYTFYKYNPSNGPAPYSISGLTKMTYDEVLDLFAEQGILPALYDISDLMKVSAFDIKTVDSDIKSKYSDLLGLGDYKAVVSKNASDDVKSSVNYVTDIVNKMRSQIRETSFLKSFQNQTFRSTSGIPGCISKYMDAYFDVVGSLLNSLTQETDAIMSMAKAFFDLDVSVTNKYNQSEEVSDTTTVPIVESSNNEEKSSPNKPVDTGKASGNGGYYDGGYSSSRDDSPTPKKSDESSDEDILEEPVIDEPDTTLTFTPVEPDEKETTNNLVHNSQKKKEEPVASDNSNTKSETSNTSIQPDTTKTDEQTTSDKSTKTDKPVTSDEKVKSEEPVVSEESVINNEEIIPRKGNSGLKDIGLAALGAASVAGAGYAGYKLYQNAKNNQSFADDVDDVKEKNDDSSDINEV